MFVDDDTETSTCTAGATFDLARNTWVPAEGCSSTPLPRTMPEKAVSFALIRHQCSDVKYVTVDGSIVPELLPGGFMIGPDCVPHPNTPTCSSCSASWSEAAFIDDGPFVLRTKLGPVLRRKIRLQCICQNKILWNPASEYVHTIRNHAEGGKAATLFCFHKPLHV